jgi:hypothetical protein
VLAAALLLAAVVQPVEAQQRFLRFEGGIGVHPLSNVTINGEGGVVVSPNAVRGVPPGGQPWVIADLTADIRADGRIRVDGRGLLLAGGNNVGLNGGASVIATLICEDNIQRSTDAVGVALAPDGDFRINDMLSPWPPTTCESPVLLIRNTAGRWFAAGILKR